MRKTYVTPEACIEQLGMEGAILQASGNFLREDYGDRVTDEWEG